MYPGATCRHKQLSKQLCTAIGRVRLLYVCRKPMFHVYIYKYVPIKIHRKQLELLMLPWKQLPNISRNCAIASISRRKYSSLKVHLNFRSEYWLLEELLVHPRQLQICFPCTIISIHIIQLNTIDGEIINIALIFVMKSNSIYYCAH